MNLNFEGKSVVVTGSGSNIGRAIALAFARERASVTIAEIDEAQGKKVVAEAEQLGAKAQVVRTDVTKWSDVQAMVRLVEERFGRVDVLVNNVAGRVTRSSSRRRATSGKKRCRSTSGP